MQYVFITNITFFNKEREINQDSETDTCVTVGNMEHALPKFY